MQVADAPIHTNVDPTTLYIPLAEAGDERDPVALEPERIGFRFAGLRLVQLLPGASRRIEASDREHAVIPIGGDLTVSVDGGETWELAGRPSVFEGVPDVAAIGRDTAFELRAGDTPVEVALAFARARSPIQACMIRSADVPVEVRGAGVATRQLNNLFAPGVGPFDRLTVVEGLVPGGNWASWPPHKHDAPEGDEAVLEEIYWFRVRGEGGWAAHRTYDLEEGWDVTATVRDGDAFLVPRGYHGPEMAAPGHDLYFLNVLAGPGAERSLAFTDDPAHAHVRDDWKTMEPDPRVPLTGARS
jgi:5-deoxy-glucuronate isomerase